MKTNLTIKNFRVFDENGVTIELNPITILTGCNSSGKSSVVKAVFLLDSFLCQIKKDIENGNPVKLNEYKLDFNTYPNNLLGGFDKVVHSGSSFRQIAMEYTVYSLMLSKDVTVRLVFTADNNDKLNNAYLGNISMSTTDGVFFSSGEFNEDNIFGKGNNYNLNVIKEDFLDFLQIDFLVHGFIGLCGEYDGPYCGQKTISKEEYEEGRDQIVSLLRGFDKRRIKDVANHVYYAKPGYGDIIRKQKADYNVVEWTKEHGSLFYIPILERLKDVSKDQIWSVIETDILKCESEKIEYIASKKIIDSFIASDAESLGDYFAMFEKEYLDRQEDRMVNSRSQTPNSPSIKLGLGISQEYLAYDPRTSKSFAVFDDEGNFNPSEIDDSAEEFEKWKNRPISFDMIYEVVMLWNSRAGSNNPETEKFYKYFFGSLVWEYEHTMIRLLRTFVSQLLEELVTPNWCGNMKYVSSSRVSVKRLYPLEVADDFTQLLKSYFEGLRLYLKGNKKSNSESYEINSFMNKWIKKLGIGESVSVIVDKEGLGVQIRIHKTQGDEGRLLADEGYGITQLVSILLQIEVAILNSKKTKTNNYLGLEAFGKFIDDYLAVKCEEVTIAVEEPEIHLHPAYQSLLADMFMEAYEKYNVHFIVETHSEYLIRKLQVLVADKENALAPNDVSLNYVEKDESGGSMNRKIDILEDGGLSDTFGSGFYDEADALAMDLFRKKPILS